MPAPKAIALTALVPEEHNMIHLDYDVNDDLTRIRSRQSAGSAARARISDAIRSLRKELKAAQRKYDTNNPPPLEDV